ncbi:TetR/AcrR family transcriptional regulator [Streptomyces sp. TRM 70351]|uniref:TetR/AcrR family transcriptional regulator n=1 Tax=Streptomyces sp. TRM 70351 TaxID=3116552 RepID=UPI002E7BBD0E|nr:TetR/AcrR family transcriptional regulator [Streptomyces sp. TRM 70351]MEE1927407.1 TetR/AcrR family transcriptional regulator [Streptomyces sp. TRM 70351]
MVSISNEGQDRSRHRTGDAADAPPAGHPEAGHRETGHRETGRQTAPRRDAGTPPAAGEGAAAPGTAADPMADTLLDAAFHCVATFGLRRLTLTDVARRAGVSRPTIYRRWRDMDSLVGDLLTREMHGVLLAAVPVAAARGGDGRTRLVAGAAAVLAALRDHPLVARILDTEPETLVTYTFQRLGSSQRDALTFTEEQIRAGQADGSIRAGDPAELARMVMLLVQTTATSWRLVDDVLPLERLTRELRHLLDAYLRPPEATP